LVGGFAESPYMYEKIKMFAKDLRLQASRPERAYVAPLTSPSALINLLIDGQRSFEVLQRWVLRVEA
jgi:hypothetical protein